MRAQLLFLPDRRRPKHSEVVKVWKQDMADLKKHLVKSDGSLPVYNCIFEMIESGTNPDWNIRKNMSELIAVRFVYLIL
jgi:hypothetical protein